LSEKRPTKKINAKAIMTDLKEGMTDAQLMEKYGLSFQGLRDLFSKLVEAGLATQAYFTRRALEKVSPPEAEATPTTCPYCGFTAREKFTRCPRCKNDTSEWLDTVELTKILTGSFD